MTKPSSLKLALILFLSFTASLSAQLPDSYYIEGVHNIGWEQGMCHVASFGNLLAYFIDEPNLPSYQLAVRSSDMTQAAWMSGISGDRIYSHPRWLQAGPLVDMSRLCGVGLHVGYGDSDCDPLAESEVAETLTIFQSEQEAITELKTLIASGLPVQVHVDMYYLDNIYPHADHRVVVHGYDTDYIYYTDNGEAGTKENIALAWQDFLTGWRLTPNLNPQNPAPPYIMIHITDTPSLADDSWTLAWLALDALVGTPKETIGPDAIRALAAALRDGENPEYALDSTMRPVFDNQRPYFADYLENLELDELAVLWRQSCTNWADILQYSQTDWSQIPALLDDIADKEESVLTTLAALADQVDQVALFAPADSAVTDDLTELTFRWLPLPDITEKLQLEFALTGDFNDDDHVVAVKIRTKNNTTQVSAKDWLKVLVRDNDDQHLTWRVVGSSKKSDVSSTGHDLYWSPLEMTALTPEDSATAVAGESLVFSFTAPTLAQKPVVVFSTTGDFSDKKSLVTLKVKKGQTQAELTDKYISKLQKKDDGDSTVYWRVEDSKSSKTTVAPSSTQTLYIP